MHKRWFRDKFAKSACVLFLEACHLGCEGDLHLSLSLSLLCVWVYTCNSLHVSLSVSFCPPVCMCSCGFVHFFPQLKFYLLWISSSGIAWRTNLHKAQKPGKALSIAVELAQNKLLCRTTRKKKIYFWIYWKCSNRNCATISSKDKSFCKRSEFPRAILIWWRLLIVASIERGFSLPDWMIGKRFGIVNSFLGKQDCIKQRAHWNPESGFGCLSPRTAMFPEKSSCHLCVGYFDSGQTESGTENEVLQRWVKWTKLCTEGTSLEWSTLAKCFWSLLLKALFNKRIRFCPGDFFWNPSVLMRKLWRLSTKSEQRCTLPWLDSNHNFIHMSCHCPKNIFFSCHPKTTTPGSDPIPQYESAPLESQHHNKWSIQNWKDESRLARFSK